MRSSRLKNVAGILLTALTITAGRSSAADQPSGGVDRPNLIVVLTDDQGWGDLSLHGNRNLSTPNLDALARCGAQLSHFYVCPVCSPTRAELLTGRWHPRGGVRDVTSGGERLDLDEVTIADAFRSAGYRTGLFGKWHNGTQGPYHPIRRGFDEFYGFTSGHWGHYFSPMLEENDELTHGDGYLPDDLTNHAIDFIRRDDARPFFALLTLNTPHGPMQVPDAWWRRVQDRQIEQRGPNPDKEDLQFTRAAMAMVENIDSNVGRLLGMLDEMKMTDNTIVVFFCDNGPNSDRWNGGMRGRKGSTDEGGTRSPFFIRWPGHITVGAVVPEIAGAVDLLPTLTGLAGIPLLPFKPLDGRSLEPLLKVSATDWPDRTLLTHWNRKVSARNQRFRLDDSGRLYNIEDDPGQTTDVQTQHPEIHQQLTDAVQNYRSEVLGELDGTPRPFVIDDDSGNRTTLLPARDATISGGLKRSSRHPNCSYITNWTSAEDAILWNIDVTEAGTFDVELLYTCEAPEIGSTIELRSARSDSPLVKLSAMIAEPAESPLIGAAEDRVLRTESLVKDFSRRKLGVLSLEKGVQQLTLQATAVAGSQVADFRLLILTRQTAFLRDALSRTSALAEPVAHNPE